MKPTLRPLKRKTARVPNNMVRGASLAKLPPLPLRLFLVMVHAANQRLSGKQFAGLPVRLAGADLSFSLSWERLAELGLAGPTALSHRNYRDLRVAAAVLRKFGAERESIDSSGHRSYLGVNFVELVKLTQEKSFTWTLTPSFAEALAILAEDARFTTLPIEDAMALSESSHIVLLMLGCRVQNFTHRSAREYGVDDLRRILGLTARINDQWFELSRKLNAWASAISKRTSYRLCLVPVKDGRRVTRVRFDIERRTKQPALPAPQPAHVPNYKPRIKRSLHEV